MFVRDGVEDEETRFGGAIGVLKVTAILSLGHGAREGAAAPPLVKKIQRQDFTHRVCRKMGADPCPQTEAGSTPPSEKCCRGSRRLKVPPYLLSTHSFTPPPPPNTKYPRTTQSFTNTAQNSADRQLRPNPPLDTASASRSRFPFLLLFSFIVL